MYVCLSVYAQSCNVVRYLVEVVVRNKDSGFVHNKIFNQNTALLLYNNYMSCDIF